MNIYLYSYNNYYNRIIKRGENLDSYGSILVSRENVNFNPNDGVDTELIVNYADDLKPDYLIVADDEGISSRWFIMDAARIRSQQYRLKLHRDVIADHYDAVINAPAYIEKATLSAGDPLIYNSENFSVNQIKTSENLLKDKSGIPWIVGYISEKNNQDHEVNELTAPYYSDALADIKVSNLSAWEYSTSKTYGVLEGLVTHIYAKVRPVINTAPEYYRFDINHVGDTVINRIGIASTNYWWDKGEEAITKLKIEAVYPVHFEFIANAVKSYITGVEWTDDKVAIVNLDGRTLYDQKEERFYKISINRTDITTSITNTDGDLYKMLVRFVSDANIFTGEATKNAFEETVRYFGYKITLTEVTSAAGTVTLPAERYKANDGTFDMFCMPYADVDFFENGVKKGTQLKEVSLAAATGLARKYYGAGVIYDLQLIPFCPAPYVLDQDGRIEIGDYIKGTIDYGNAVQGYVFFPTETNHTFDIPFEIPIENDAVEKKVKIQCDTYRICSPNYNGVFEFNPQKNGGVQYFNVDMTLKPYTPYIHINPNFGELYGSDFDDARGLICGGDFSLPINTDAWATYELQNKNYQKSFDRQIEHIEFNNRMQNIADITSAAVGTVGGAVGGAGASSALGAGMGIGAVVGGALSAAGGVADVLLNRQVREEALDFTKDNFGYQLGNIQALPYSLAKVTAYTKNNKIFPFVEHYTCTEREKEAFRNKLKYNGMTVMAIGKIADYIRLNQSYIKGKLIRLDEIAEDYHVVTAIANELNKGVFI